MGRSGRSPEPHRFHSVGSNDDVGQHRQLAVTRDAREADSEGDVGLARRRIAARVIMDQDEARRAHSAASIDDVSDADTNFANCPASDSLRRQQVAMIVKEESKHPFVCFDRQGGDILFELGQAAQSPRMSRDSGPLQPARLRLPACRACLSLTSASQRRVNQWSKFQFTAPVPTVIREFSQRFGNSPIAASTDEVKRRDLDRRAVVQSDFVGPPSRNTQMLGSIESISTARLGAAASNLWG